jgi:hypothetical protein
MWIILIITSSSIIAGIVCLLMVVSIGVYLLYEISKGFAFVADELGEELLTIEEVKWDTMRFYTSTMGEFILKQDLGGKYSSGHFILDIETEKVPPKIDIEELKDPFMSNYFYNVGGEAALKDFVPLDRVKRIGSISQIKFLYGDTINKIQASLFNNICLDGKIGVLSVLKLLKGIEARM